MVKFINFDLVSYDDTKQFGKNQENRAYNHAHLEKIKKQCKVSMEAMPPITINKVTNHIVDGQHRLRAYQSLVENKEIDANTKIKVMYVEIPVEEEKQAIIDANTNSKNWSLDDYIDSYAKAGIVSYVKLKEWCTKHALANDGDKKARFRYGAAIITGKRCSSELKNGLFSFSPDEIARAEEVHAEMLEIVKTFDLKGKGHWIESLATSWVSVRERHDFRTWLKELKSKKRFLKCPKDNSKDWDNIFAQAHLAIDKKSGL